MSDLRSDISHLLRRAAFGGTPEEVERYVAMGYEAAVDDLCDLTRPDPAADAITPPTFDTAGYIAAQRSGDEAAKAAAQARNGEERIALMLWWVRRMVAAERPAREKLTFFWHDHFATSVDKVNLAALMHRQWRTLHDLGAGRFDDLVHAVARDPAMLIWLDGRDSTAAAPNENFARELLELFTLGHGGTAHGGHPGGQPYTERDVQEAARALTGWVIDRTDGTTSLNPTRHDTGTKTVLGTTGPLGLDEIVAITTGHAACAPHLVAQLWSRLARPAGPDDPVVRDLAAGFARDLDVTELLRSMLLHPDFRSTETRTALVRTPVDLVVGTLRSLGITPERPALRALRSLGQVPFLPPDVAGWPANEAWLSTSSAMVRLQAAQSIAQSTPVPELVDAPAADRSDVVGRLLGIDAWSDATAAALREAAADPKLVLAVALASPEHLVA